MSSRNGSGSSGSSGGGKGGSRGGGKEGKGSKHKPHFVRQIPNFLKQYETMLTTNKKNYMNEEVKKEGKNHKCVADAIADGATVFDDSPQVEVVPTGEDEEEGSEAVVAVTEGGTQEEKTRGEEEDEDTHKEYYRDGKIVFNKLPNALKRKHKNSSTETEEEGGDGDVNSKDHTGKKKKEKKKQKKQLGLLSFDTSGEDDA